MSLPSHMVGAAVRAAGLDNVGVCMRTHGFFHSVQMQHVSLGLKRKAVPDMLCSALSLRTDKREFRVTKL